MNSEDELRQGTNVMMRPVRGVDKSATEEMGHRTWETRRAPALEGGAFETHLFLYGV